MAGNDEYTKLLIHSDDTDGSTTFTDSSTSNHTLTSYGSAHHETDQAKFGASSIRIGAVGDYITLPDTDDVHFGSSDFTIDCWVYIDSFADYRSIFGQMPSSPSASNIATYLRIEQTTGQIFFRIGNGSSVYTLTTTSSITAATWHHIAFIRYNNTLYVAIDGTFDATTVNVSGVTHLNSNYTPTIGRLGDYTGFTLAGYIDEFRISKGVARWTSNFTPPTSIYTTAALLRALCNQVYDLEGALLRMLFDQKYDINEAQRALFNQLISLRMLTSFRQLIGDMPQFRMAFDQRFGDCFMMRRICNQAIDNANRYRTTFDQIWSYPKALRSIFAEKYGLASHEVRALADQQYDLLDKELLRSVLDQLYILASGFGVVQKADITITCNGVEHRSATNIMLEQDDAQFYCIGSLQLANQAEYFQYGKWMGGVTVQIGDVTANLMTEIPYISRPEVANDTYIVPLVSPTKLLDAPHNKLVAQEFSGMASEICAALATPFDVDWQLVDWYIPAGILTSTGESAISVIKRIVGAARGIVQTPLSGYTLICRPEYPVSPPNWGSVEPGIELSDQDVFSSVIPNPSPRAGHNVFFASNQEFASDGVSMEHVEISSSVKEVHVFITPWSDRYQANLLHSGGSWVQVIANGVVAEEITEQIEIKNGSGQTSKPCFELIDYEWGYRDLGNLSVVENGTATADDEQHSLVTVTYTTKYWSFTATDNEIEDVQFYPEVLEIA
ncbi:LamG domain-containing protein [Desulforhopalus singaporensis]|uniref:Concanavalin A-like lectin/glucanases superfamily protein n=1 Tax=Desulforhopalus singaporensis TaxID=91360 RepID=A0A1H0UUF4_9BACT|nr:LamG domain-containing protein [Desulforhopalus singaporensis]SDP69857.1 Concanavalin A-like lectin/glucanases superfamily protein [Desulforhopalus singaporensis]